MGLFKISEVFSKNGIGEGMNAREVAEKHGVSVDSIEEQIEKGMKVELEHTSDLDRARKIAIDHLAEFPDYYDRLAKMEEEAKAEEQKLTEEFSSFLLEEIGGLKREVFRSLSESELAGDSDVRYWVDWKLTKFNIRSLDESFADKFLGELHGDPARVAAMTRREKILEVMEAADAMPRELKGRMTEMDAVKGEKRSRVVSGAIKAIKSKKI
jgi:hypothetical protein